MSSRVLRKARARAAAKVVNYDEGGNDSDDDEPIMRKCDDTPADEPEPSSRSTPDADAEMQPTGAENSASGSVSGTPSETPSDVGPFKPAPRKVRLRLGKASKVPSPAKPILDEDEDEDELVDENDEEGEEEEVDESGGSESESDDELGPSSTSMGGARPGMPMTARQAALAGLSTSSTPLISLDQIEASRRKGPEKTEEELAAKRREAAKRRKQQLVQKTQAEKVVTLRLEGAVDRLLNKQAPRPRARRNQSGLNTAAPGTPAGYATPVRGSGGGDTRSTSPDGDENGEEEEEDIPPPPEPTMMRWVSSSRDLGSKTSLIEEIKPSTGESEAAAAAVATKDVDVEMTGPSEEGGKKPSPEEKQAQVAAEGSVPTGSEAAGPESTVTRGPAAAPEKKELTFSLSIPATILEQLTASLPPSPPAIRPGPTVCGITGCKEAKKYRVIVPGGEEKGACGLEHFKMLKGSVGTA
ncbi:hypothetical protein FRC00_001380 [Tulasnella sp. 408]|nr:hypothetical protein FRC00_001380 [Tulasnella sp. 408]